ncbi:hypothetical protein G6F56_002401 [Rhizopus delemar]|uniref:Uncharacterized protein n=1 Tax=Rhizopus stolonifer TaxID=4846 RepID=A0A367KVM9_RHIST|nr:hypothetical protein G6F56_002401 [Rhizopus delemar]RCI06256.1 hypothetical protein CU098_010816 [Rhizopus stolonifer]
MKQIKKLNKKPNRILRNYSNQGILSELLPVVEIESLKSGKLWRKSGEKYASLPPVRLKKKMKVVYSFYQRLYISEAINEEKIDFLLGIGTHRDQQRILTLADQKLLITLFTLDDIIDASKRTPKKE